MGSSNLKNGSQLFSEEDIALELCLPQKWENVHYSRRKMLVASYTMAWL